MRFHHLAVIGLSTVTLGLGPASAQERGGLDPELAKEIRRIVREEVRAALGDAAKPDTAEPKRTAARGDARRVARLDLAQGVEKPESVRTIVRELDADGRVIRVRAPRIAERVDTEDLREVLEKQLEPKLRDVERRLEVIVKRLDDSTAGTEATMKTAIERALKSIEGIVPEPSGHPEVRVERIEASPKIQVLRTGDAKQFQFQLQLQKDDDEPQVSVQGEPIQFEFQLQKNGDEPQVRVQRGEREVPVQVRIEKVRESGQDAHGAEVIRVRKVETDAAPKKDGDGDCCDESGCCAEPGCCEPKPKGRIMV